MRNHLMERWGHFSITVLTGLCVVTIINVFSSIFLNPIFILNENQLLYLFSAMAQIMGGVFGLTLTAYVFFVDKFKESAKNDDTYYDATDVLLSRYFYILILIAVTCGATIVMCIAGIVTLHNWTIVYPFILRESVLIFFVGIISILVFGTMLLDPKKLDKEIVKMKKQAEEHYKAKGSTQAGDFTKFLRTYNLLEQVIIEFAKARVKGQTTYYQNYRPQIIQSLKILNTTEIINRSLLSEINEFRIYRNGLVHGVDFNVTQNACNRISDIYKALKDAFDVFKNNGTDSKEWREAIEKINNLTR